MWLLVSATNSSSLSLTLHTLHPHASTWYFQKHYLGDCLLKLKLSTYHPGTSSFPFQISLEEGHLLSTNMSTAQDNIEGLLLNGDFLLLSGILQ